MTLVTALVALAAAVIGALVAPYITQSRERLHARSAVYDALVRGRYAWFPDADTMRYGIPNWSAESFILEFERLAMLARVPLRLVGYYVVAVRRVQENYGEEDEWGGFHPASEDAKQLDRATRRLVFWLWHPVLGWVASLFLVKRAYATDVRSYDW